MDLAQVSEIVGLEMRNVALQDGYVFLDLLQAVVQVGELLGLVDGLGWYFLYFRHLLTLPLSFSLSFALIVIRALAITRVLGRLLYLRLALTELPVIALMVRLVIISRNDKFENLKRIGEFGGCGGDAKVVTGWETDVGRLETGLAVDLDLEVLECLADFDLRGAAEVAVGKGAVAEGEGVDTVVGGVFGEAVVEETAECTGLFGRNSGVRIERTG